MNEEIISFYSKAATHRLILLHGWGADANDLIPLGKTLVSSLESKFEVMALSAPEYHPDGFGRQWYGLFPSDWSSVPGAIKSLQSRLKKIGSNQIPFDKTFLLGFSQGGAMALASGCHFPFAGLICCSAYPHPGWKPPSISSPILLIHGCEDNVVPKEASNEIASLLDKNKLEFYSHSFYGGHEIPEEAIDVIRAFIIKCI